MQDWCMGKDFKTFIPLSVIWDSFSGSLPENILGKFPCLITVPVLYSLSGKKRIFWFWTSFFLPEWECSVFFFGILSGAFWLRETNSGWGILGQISSKGLEKEVWDKNWRRLFSTCLPQARRESILRVGNLQLLLFIRSLNAFLVSPLRQGLWKKWWYKVNRVPVLKIFIV